MSDGGFNLREWSSNSEMLNSSINKDDKCLKPIVKVLGVLWDTIADELQIKPFIPNQNSNVNRREIVSALAKTFDPYGFIMPITVTGKIFLQDLCKLNMGWDTLIPDDYVKK